MNWKLFFHRFSDPLELQGLKLWLAADRITGLADADPVGTWSDLSGLGNDATQATAAKKPLYKVNILNGRPVVRFDGTDDSLALGSSTLLDLGLTDDLTAFIVFSTSTANRAFFGKKLHGGVLVAGYHLLENASGFLNLRFSDATDQVQSLGSSSIADGNGQICAVVIDQDVTQFIYQNGVLADSDDISAVDNPSNAIVFRIGADGQESAPLNGDIAELIVYNRALSTAERQQVERYLGNKYGITVA